MIVYESYIFSNNPYIVQYNVGFWTITSFSPAMYCAVPLLFRWQD